jgi:hypothetical protein
MTLNKSAGFSVFGLVVVSAIVVCVVCIVVLAGKSERSFPLLPAGAYVGQVVAGGIADDNGATLYIEKPAGRKILLMTVFKEGWKPQTIPLKRLETSDPAAEIRYLPVQIKHGGRSYSFAGQQSQGGYGGEVMDSRGTHGTWLVRRIEQEEMLDFSTKVADGGEDLGEWLAVRRTHRHLEERLASVEAVYDKKQRELQDMQAVLDNEDQLKQRSEAKLAALSEKVENARSERDRVSKQVKDLVGELDLLGRITARGKVVRLARKVASRENKWYTANWGAAQQDLSAAEEQYAETMNIDLRQLDREYKRAREVTALQRELERERAMLFELKRRMQRRIDPQSGDPRHEPLPPNRRIWDRLFG